MERGLLWLPLLIIFIALAWSGWNEFKKVEAYQSWAQDLDNAKYDIYAVLGRKQDQVTYGKSTRKGIVDLKSFCLKDIAEINVLINGDRVTDLNSPPQKGKPTLEFKPFNDENSIEIPFTDIDLTIKWQQYLSVKPQSNNKK